MWIIQSDTLMELPDDLLLPPNSTKVEVLPPDLFTAPRNFHVENGVLKSNGKAVPSATLFTPDEIALLKQLVATTAINPAPAVAAVAAAETAPKKGRRKENK